MFQANKNKHVINGLPCLQIERNLEKQKQKKKELLRYMKKSVKLTKSAYDNPFGINISFFAILS